MREREHERERGGKLFPGSQQHIYDFDARTLGQRVKNVSTVKR